MNNKPIQFPESYYSTLTQEEVQEVAIALGKKFEDNHKNYDYSFGRIRNSICRLVQDNIKKNNITSKMKWKSVESAASWTQDTTIFTQHLSNIAGDREAENYCIFALHQKGTLSEKLTIKVGRIIRDLIIANVPNADPACGIMYDIENLRIDYLFRVESSFSSQLSTVNMRMMEDDDHGGSKLYRSISIKSSKLTQAIKDLDLEDCQSIAEAEILLDKIVNGKTQVL